MHFIYQNMQKYEFKFFKYIIHKNIVTKKYILFTEIHQ